MNINSIDTFLSKYDREVFENAMKLRKVIVALLPDINEELDLPAKMIAYSYGKKYSEMVCTIIPSKKGIKLGFYKGNELEDPDHLLEGEGKISRYVQIDRKLIESAELKSLLLRALDACKERMQ
jgi:hypothetical protein